MRYIDLIKGFWRSHDTEAFPTNAIALYFYLLEVNNKASWIPSFKRNNAKVCADLCISYPTLNKIRNRLKQAGLIDFKTINGSPNVQYTFKNIFKVNDEFGNEVSNEVGDEVCSRSGMTKDTIINNSMTKTKTKTKGKLFTPPSIEEVKNYFFQNGYSEQSAVKAFNYYDAGDWKDSKGNKVKSWKQKMQGVWFKPENKSKEEKSTKRLYIPAEENTWN